MHCQVAAEAARRFAAECVATQRVPAERVAAECVAAVRGAAECVATETAKRVAAECVEAEHAASERCAGSNAQPLSDRMHVTVSKAAPKDAHVEVKRLKNKGNKACMARRWAEAATEYGRTIELWPQSRRARGRGQDHTCWSNCSAAYLELEVEESLHDAESLQRSSRTTGGHTTGREWRT